MLKFLGQDKLHCLSFVGICTRHMCRNMERLVRENLEDVLGVTFPSPQDSDRDDVTSECIICYSYRLLDGTIPVLPPLIHQVDLSLLL
jgi:hypothetical protein